LKLVGTRHKVRRHSVKNVQSAAKEYSKYPKSFVRQELFDTFDPNISGLFDLNIKYAFKACRRRSQNFHLKLDIKWQSEV